MRCFLPILALGFLLSYALSGQAQTPITVQLNWKHQFEFAAFYAAIEQGYYQKENLDVTLREGGPGINAVAEVTAGRAAFAVGNSSLIIERWRGNPVVALAALMQHSAIAILARRDHGIENVTDLIGKSIACSAHSCDEITAYLSASGLNPSQVKLIDHQQWGLSDLRGGTLDATEVYSTNEPYWVIGEAHRYILLPPRSAGIDLYGNILFTSDQAIAANPELVQRFRAATLQGLSYAMANREAVVNLILERYNSQNKSRDHLLFEADRLHEHIRLDIVDAGYMSSSRWAHVRDVYARLGMLPEQFPLDGFVYEPSLPSISPWLLRLGGVLALLTLLASLTSVFVGRVNKRLRSEVDTRRMAEVKLKQAQQRMRQFIEDVNALLSHELRTPLATMQIHLDILRMKVNEEAEVKRNLNAIEQAVKRLDSLFGSQIKQLLADSSLVAQGQRVLLAEEVERLVNEFSLQHPHAQLSLSPKVTIGEVSIAPEMLRTVLFNLFENAVKYGLPNHPITIKIKADNQFATLTIENVPAYKISDDTEQLFAKNFRGNVDDSLPGTGLGLYLVRMIVQAHGGRVSANLDGSGRFVVHVTLPCG
jgi:ABC-type nitrate/sulfonate/bicarbonate transport system substrate-binding protein/nitrogen-specific signal transduction histidine kinase